jgi:hypothetical protein
MWMKLPSFLLLPVVEEELSEAGALDPLEELFGDDLIGVYIVPIKERNLPVDYVDRFHG